MAEPGVFFPNLFRTVAKVERRADLLFAPAGVTTQEFIVLWKIRSGIDTNASLLCMVHGSKPNLSKKLRSLETAGLIRRFPDLSDARVFRILLTDAGHAALGLADEIYRKTILVLSDGISPASLETAASVLATIEANLARL